MSNVTLYIIGSLFIAGGLGYGTSLFLGPAWAMVVSAVCVGLGIMSAVSSGRRRESAPAEQ